MSTHLKLTLVKHSKCKRKANKPLTHLLVCVGMPSSTLDVTTSTTPTRTKYSHPFHTPLAHAPPAVLIDYQKLGSKCTIKKRTSRENVKIISHLQLWLSKATHTHTHTHTYIHKWCMNSLLAADCNVNLMRSERWRLSVVQVVYVINYANGSSKKDKLILYPRVCTVRNVAGFGYKL